MANDTVINIPNHEKGQTFAGYQFNAVDEDGNPYDLTDATISFPLRFGNSEGTLIDTFTIGDGLAWVNQAQGKFKLTFDLGTLAYGKYFYNPAITLADLTVDYPFYGSVKITQSN